MVGRHAARALRRGSLRRLAAVGCAVLAGLLLAFGCADGGSAADCYEGEYLGCTCAQEPGYQRCAGGVYGACVCDGRTPGLDGGVAGMGSTGAAGGGGAGLLPFMAVCDDNADCETLLCHVFNAKGPRCTKPCQSPDDCPPPSTGCNNMGICKAP